MTVRSALSYTWLSVFLGCSLTGCGTAETGVPTTPVFGKLTVDGAPAEGVSITCIDPKSPKDDKGFHASSFATISGPEGEFSFSLSEEQIGLPEGDYVLTFVWLKNVDSPSSVLADKDFLNRRYATEKQSPKKFSVTLDTDVDLGTIELSTRK